MSVRSAQSITVLFTTRSFSTGVATDADSTPAGTLYVNGTSNAASVTVTNITTGIYKAAVTLPTLAVGDVVDLRIAATVNSVADNAVVWRDTKDIVIDSAGLADATAVKLGPSGSATAQTARDVGASVLVGDKTGYALTSDYDAAKTAATQTSVDAVKAVTDLLPDAGALTSIDDAVLSAIAGLNDAPDVSSDVDDIKSRLPAALTGDGNIKADALRIDGNATAASNLAASASVIYQGTVTGAATTTTLVDSGLTQADNDHWNGRVVIFLTGDLKYQATAITDFDADADTLTFAALTNAPATSDAFIVV